MTLDPSGAADFAWGLPGGVNVSAILAQLEDTCASGPLSVGGTVDVTNGVTLTVFSDIEARLEASPREWDEDAWDPQPAQDASSKLATYGAVLEGAVPLVDAGCQSSGEFEVIGFAWAAIYDVRAGSNPWVRLRPEVTTAYHAQGRHPDRSKEPGNVR